MAYEYQDGRSALHHALERRHLPAVAALLDGGCDVEAADQVCVKERDGGRWREMEGDREPDRE